jgi:hypothetical protein
MATRYTAIDNKKYILCYNIETPILHYVILETGQPEIEIYDTENKYKIK